MSKSNISNAAEKLDSDLLRTFLAVAETGSISAGAARVFRSQSAVSLQVKRLEERVGQALFRRHGRGVLTTAAGDELRLVAERVIDLLDEALGRLRTDAVAGTLRVGIPDEYGERVLPRVLAAFSRAYPRVDLTVRCALGADFPRALGRGDLDIAVHDVETPRPKQQVLIRQRAVWATSAGHLAHEMDPVPLALFDRDCWWRDHAVEAMRRRGRTFRIAFTSESVAGVAAAVEAGIAVGLLGADMLRGDLRELTEADGFERLPESALVIDCRDGVDPALSDAMCAAIRTAFRLVVP